MGWEDGEKGKGPKPKRGAKGRRQTIEGGGPTGTDVSLPEPIFSSPVCGKPVHPVEQRQRIIGGQKAKLGNFPWQAYTNIHGPGGGALLGDRWILTAAHTINPKDHEAQGSPSLDVFLGHVIVEDITKLSNHPVRRVIIDPDYHQEESHNFEGDIALLELENSITLGPNLLPICLLDNETLYDLGLIGYVSGFGIMEERISHDLGFVHLPVAKREICECWLWQKKKKKKTGMMCFLKTFSVLGAQP